MGKQKIKKPGLTNECSYVYIQLAEVFLIVVGKHTLFYALNNNLVAGLIHPTLRIVMRIASI